MNELIDSMHPAISAPAYYLASAIAVSLAWAASVHAADPVSVEQLGRCAAIADDRERLACFDRLVARAGAGEEKGNWRVRDEISSLDDTRRVYFELQGEPPIPLRRGSYAPTLTIQCAPQQTSVFLDVGVEVDLSRVGGAGERFYAVTLRYDREASHEVEMRGIDNGQRLFFPEPLAEIERMKRHGHLLVGVQPFSRDRVATGFELTSLDRAMAPYGEICGQGDASDG
ncbi:MAG: hypothetical protein GWO16_08075 [Gammaproteobacteria bacterium]|nr:hypothetical protein [Gammaproteobacteria bacterium]NIR97899.1 hypothetical protein [Gammaproteobacteria bacterium]NIT63604.1 hypothetical protein [Gammaproteobacteria bacterium]NIV20540.1 hypothetical protein [Gammaproteobacteria bacterium]NIY32184.1 hypothetical protein [Gammaproteobacteria bacterium]